MKKLFKDCFRIIRVIGAHMWKLREHKRGLHAASVVGTFFKYLVTYTHAPYIALHCYLYYIYGG